MIEVNFQVTLVDFDFHLEDRGVLMAFKTSKAEKSEYSRRGLVSRGR